MRYLVNVSYDGSDYYGFQRQKDQNTIQSVIEKSLKLMTKKDIKIYSAGRTDKGVHALGQTFHFDCSLPISEDIWKDAINHSLPLDVRVLDVKKVSKDFHARHHAKKRTYKYIISKTPTTVLNQRYKVYVKDFNYNIAKDCLGKFVGVKNFSGFAKADKGKDCIREVESLTLHETKEDYVFTIVAKSFLRYMVRSIIGTIIDIAIEKKQIDIIDDVFRTNDRKLAGKTAEARGLYLTEVTY